jgi:ferric-dicitrate binding protein FerR (iron transport regulator)
MEHLAGIPTLIFKYIRKDLTTEEANQLQRWIEQSEKNRIFFDEVTQTGHLFKEAQSRSADDQEINMEVVWQKLVDKGIPKERTYIPYIPEQSTGRGGWYAAAAVLLLLIAGGAWFLLNRKPVVQDTVALTPAKQQPISNDVSPLSRKATLTLANGSVVVLDSAQHGILAMEGATSVTKRADGQIVYNMTDIDQSVLYNTLTVPRGGNVVHITLSDGTKVWLNAASSLYYPVAFSGDERKVEITGEAYFEVAHNAAVPFKVSKGQMEVSVLGTHFNVNAYHEEEAIKVTLLEGRVKVVNRDTLIGNNESAILKPGQQAVVQSAGELTVSSDIDQEAIMAWKNGLFYFENTNIDIIVRQIERWYDVSIEYDNSLQHVAFNGQISRYSNASEVLEMLEAAEALHFKIKDRKIYLTPYRK